MLTGKPTEFPVKAVGASSRRQFGSILAIPTLKPAEQMLSRGGWPGLGGDGFQSFHSQDI